MIQFLRGTQTQLNSSSQVFAAGQPIFESDSGQLKIGNGSSRYSSLPYVGSIFESSGGSSNLDVSYTYVDPGLQYYDIGSNLRFIRFFRNMLWDVSYYTDGDLFDVGEWSFKYNGYTSAQYFRFSTLSPISSYLYDSILNATVRCSGDHVTGASGQNTYAPRVGNASHVGVQMFDRLDQTVKFTLVLQLSTPVQEEYAYSLQFDIITYK